MFEKTFAFWRRLIGSPVSEFETETHDESAVATAEDRRLWVRYPTEINAKIRLGDKAEAEQTAVSVRDISLGGAKLITMRPLQSGQIITLQLPTENSDVRSVLACVVRSTPLVGGKYSIGCVFSRELSQADLEAFGAKREKPAAEDNRRWVRYKTNIRAEYRIVGDPERAVHEAQVLNISASGIGLQVSPPVEAGCLLNLDLFSRQGKLVRTILACVVHTTERPGENCVVAGCNFIRELSEAELQAIG